jgi:hypothetical protein
LRQTCKSRGIHFIQESEPFIGRGLVTISGSWDDFLKFRGRYFQKDLRAIERKLNNTGKWKLLLIENNNDYSDKEIFDKIMTIEKSSWKEIYRQSVGEAVDDALTWLWESSNLFQGSSQILKRKIWFLELDNRPIAFSLMFEYKETAFIAKTSFVEKYRKASPGVFVNNAAVKDLFNKGKVNRIDFLTTMSLTSVWSPTTLPRIRFTLGGRSVIGLQKARLMIRRAMNDPKLSYKPWPFSHTAKEQLKRAHTPPRRLWL